MEARNTAIILRKGNDVGSDVGSEASRVWLDCWMTLFNHHGSSVNGAQPVTENR